MSGFAKGKTNLYAEGYISGPLWKIRVRYIVDKETFTETEYVIACTCEEAIDALSEHYGEVLILGIKVITDNIWLSSAAHTAIAEDIISSSPDA